MTVETFLTAFLGAALAFLFFLAGEVFVRAYERSRVHYNALVKIEAIMNELLDEVSVLTTEVATYRNKIDEGAVRGEWAPSEELLPSEDGQGQRVSLTCLRFLDRQGQLALHSCGRWDDGASSSILVSDTTGARVFPSVDTEVAAIRVGNRTTPERRRTPHVALVADAESASLSVGPGGPHVAILTVDELMMRDERRHVFVRLPERKRAERQ